MELTATGETTKSAPERAATYAPSWVDRLTARVRRLPVPSWLVYGLAAILLAFIRNVIGWIDGSYPVGTFFRIHVLDGLTSLYLLLVLHYLDNLASSALDVFRPVLNADAEGYQKLRYEITTMPARPALAISLIGLTFGLIYYPLFVSQADLDASKYFTSPAATIVDIAISGVVWTFNAVFAYHTLHQLRLVSRIYNEHTTVSIFDTGPLYALSRVSATTTVALLALIYIYIELYDKGTIDTSTINIVIGILLVLIALVTFVWPLYGAHRLLQQEKERWKGEIARRIETIANVLHTSADAQAYTEMVSISNAIEGLVKEQSLVSKASTWPWDPEALRVVVTALLLPVVIWVITRLLERFGI